ncbi:MAG: AMP-binding protein [Actinobacteria bacterium]|nr:AMP-binding protein [Actinomycetota bacterium]MSW35681.1 AMP-binding protein [Actinomycetota bacterium]
MSPVTLTAAWVERWRFASTRPVLVDARDGEVLTGADVEHLTRTAAGRLSATGVRAGDRVLLSCAPSIDTVIAYVAILRLGAVVVPANTGYTRGELEHVIGDVRPVAAILDDPGRVDGLPLEAHQPDLATLPPSAEVPLDIADSGDIAMVAYTSGTTGRPKGALLSHANLLAGARALVEAWQWTPDDRLVHALPMFHMHGLGAALNGSFTAGASVVVLPRFDPAAVSEAIRDHEATLFFGVPTMYARMREAARLGDLAGLRLIVSGSAPLDPLLFQQIASDAGQDPLERYGMSETVMLTSNPLFGERRAGSVGLPLPGVRIRLGDDGGVEVNGPNVFRGYWENPDANREAFTDDGWFRTGDIGEFDADGYLWLVGRSSDLIITGGYNVYPREVEDAVREHPDVVDVAVVGIPDPAWGETVAAYVVTSEGADPAGIAVALDGHVESRLAPYKRPRRWTILTELPHNAMGKVRRDVLRDQGMMSS